MPAGYVSSYASVEYTSQPVQVDPKASLSLNEVLQKILPQHFDCGAANVGTDIAEAATVPQSKISPASAIQSEHASRQPARLRPGIKVLVAGIEPDLQTPLASLHALLHGPDMFLYIVVHSSSA